MNNTSKTGLLASPTKKIYKKLKKKTIQLKAVALPAPVVLRPYAGLYNPFSYGCSLLCNHPTDKEAKGVLKRARETWATENKNIILPEEIQAIREGLAYVEENNKPPLPIESIPEELFRRYTETDSRPLTPAPTLASIKTRGSSSRRCVTPDPAINSVLRERTLLILDLRRSHSQEIISWHGTNDPPVINILQAPTPSVSIDSAETPEVGMLSRKTTAKTNRSLPSPKLNPKQCEKLEVPKIQEPEVQTKIVQNILIDQSDGEEEVIKRKGKRRKKRGRDSSRGPLAVQASIDPETQVSALGTESYNPNNRPALTPGGSIQEANSATNIYNSQEKNNTTAHKSILDPNILKHLQRELTSEVIDLEFDKIRRAALQEALNALPTEKKPPCEEMILLKKELNLHPINTELWLSLPRVFSRRSARFEIPLHSIILNTLTPLEYLQQHVMVSSSRRLLYNLVFNRHKKLSDDTDARIMCKDRIQVALGEMMGKPLTEEQIIRFKSLVNWKDEDVIDFKTWCGMCALFERVFAGEFCSQLPGKDIDSCNEVEVADFLSLSKRLQLSNPDECLNKMLNAIKEL